MQKLPDDVHGSNTTSLVRVPFHGDQLDAVRDERGAWVSIRRVCEALEIAPQVQLRKLSAKAWACVTMMVMQMPGDAQTREIACGDGREGRGRTRATAALASST